MKYTPFPAELFVKHRQRFMSSMLPKSIAVFNSNDIYPVSADSTLNFEQHRDIFYLSGIDQEESVLVLFPDAPDGIQERLFVRETNDHIAVWEGAKLTQKQATAVSGVQSVHWVQNFKEIFDQLAQHCDTIYINTNEHYRAAVETQTREDRFIEWCKQNYPKHQYEKGNFILQRLRSIKDSIEIDRIQQACDITEKGFRRVLNFIQPGVWEYEIEAEWIHEFIRNRSKGFAYQPIIASGNNANVLHYTQNNMQCNAGDLILMDVAAEYANYSSDLTRTVPISGRFSKRHRTIYDAVLRVKDKATRLLVPGAFWKEYHEEVGRIMTDELLGLGLLDKADVQAQDPKKPAYKKYFMHGTSHHMGLDTHDYGLLDDPIEANMVFTVEPGIYLPEEGFGVRLEDDVVVQPTGEPINLMKNIPIEPDEIEALMND